MGQLPHIVTFMNAKQTLLSEVEKFLAVSGMKDSTFGHLTVNDGKFVARLRGGSSCTLETAERIRRFLAEHSEGKSPRGRRRQVA